MAFSSGAETPDPVLTVMTEGELAALCGVDGAAAVAHDGRFWRAVVPGFYEPFHLLGPMRASEARRPRPGCWGFRAAVAEEDAHLASGSIPVHLLADLRGWDGSALSRNRRGDLRRCRRKVEIVRVREPSLLLEQGHAVMSSAMRRLGGRRIPTPAEYRVRLLRRGRDERRLIIAGLVDGRLGGYLESWAVDDTLYNHELFIATEALATGVGTGLYVETLETAVRAGTIRQVCNGLHRPERPDLSRFKESLGYRLVHVPSVAWIPAPIAAIMKVARPRAYYHLTGVKPSTPAPRDEPRGGDTPVTVVR